MKAISLSILLFLLACVPSFAYDGTRLWLPDSAATAASVTVKAKKSPTTAICERELRQAWRGEPVELRIVKDKALGPDGYTVSPAQSRIIISANSDIGLLYGVYDLLRRQEASLPLDKAWTGVPAYPVRVLNHWDNLDGTIERGYAGESIWQWGELPQVVSPRYEQYARANASVGINGAVLNNVNASSQILSRDYLQKVARIADVLRPYGIKVYLSANFAAPMQLDSLPTADPLDPAVAKWWRNKAKEIYSLIPDFGGFLVKANSEGQPGPCDFGRTHAEGANMMARAVRPYGGIVMWRAFVYSPSDPDRAKQAYIEFQPLDGKFDSNVIVQIKNGPIDFQPREPYSPLFGAMPQTDQMAEFQITQEYLGHSNQLAYLAPMWKEFFSYVSPASIKAVAGVSNVGDAPNWTAHPFAQANWYAFGRLAWDPTLDSRQIASEWLAQTVYDDAAAVPADTKATIEDMMLDSREAVVDYMMPMGLHHLFAWGHHYGPEPWCDVPGAREDWMPRYYHRADSVGLGFDRSSTGSNAVGQYPADFAAKLDNIETCPEEFILWFHHVPWDHKLPSGLTLWDALCGHYERGVCSAERMQQQWQQAKPYVDAKLFADVEKRLMTQTRDAQWWRDGCLLYFQRFSGKPLPEGVRQPVHTFDDLIRVHLPITNYECPTPQMLNSVR